MFNFLSNLLKNNNLYTYIKNNLLKVYTNNTDIDCYLYGNIEVLKNHIKNSKINVVEYKFKHYFIYLYKMKNKFILLTPISVNTNKHSYTDFDKCIYNVFTDQNIKDTILRKVSYDLYQYYANQVKTPLVKEISEVFDSVCLHKHMLIINDVIIPKHFIYDNHNKIELIPEDCKTTIYQLKFITNNHNELLEVIVNSDNKNHPNVNPVDNKYCIGNYRYNYLTKDLVIKITNEIKIYNLTNCYNIPASLKKYVFDNK
jgi:hypothetical protein